MPSYDDIQLAARLVTCQVCGKDYYMTRPQALCVPCQDVQMKQIGCQTCRRYGKENRERERLWFSPGCLKPSGLLPFGEAVS